MLLLVIYQPLSLPKLPIVKNNNKPIESYLYVKPKQEKQQTERQTPTEIEQLKLEKVLNETPQEIMWRFKY